MTATPKPQDDTAGACATAPQASVGTPTDLPDELADAHGTPLLRDGDETGDDTPVYDDRTDDRPTP